MRRSERLERKLLVLPDSTALAVSYVSDSTENVLGSPCLSADLGVEQKLFYKGQIGEQELHQAHCDNAMTTPTRSS